MSSIFSSFDSILSAKYDMDRPGDFANILNWNANPSTDYVLKYSDSDGAKCVSCRLNFPKEELVETTAGKMCRACALHRHVFVCPICKKLIGRNSLSAEVIVPFLFFDRSTLCEYSYLTTPLIDDEYNLAFIPKKNLDKFTEVIQNALENASDSQECADFFDFSKKHYGQLICRDCIITVPNSFYALATFGDNLRRLIFHYHCLGAVDPKVLKEISPELHYKLRKDNIELKRLIIDTKLNSTYHTGLTHNLTDSELKTFNIKRSSYNTYPKLDYYFKNNTVARIKRLVYSGLVESVEMFVWYLVQKFDLYDLSGLEIDEDKANLIKEINMSNDGTSVDILINISIPDNASISEEEVNSIFNKFINKKFFNYTVHKNWVVAMRGKEIDYTPNIVRAEIINMILEDNTLTISAELKIKYGDD